jgi:hypothetical protein
MAVPNQRAHLTLDLQFCPRFAGPISLASLVALTIWLDLDKKKMMQECLLHYSWTHDIRFS